MVVPTLFINRFVVLRDHRFVYDQSFHKGINIIRGENGTGKSSVMDLLYYALGAEVKSWTDEQSRCTHTLVEAAINGRVICLKREITDTGKAPMYFFEGDTDGALQDSVNWLQYPNQRSATKHSYSQQLFEILGLPQHKTDDSKNLTMHQILRLMYVDQMTETSHLLKGDPEYDNAVIRKAIGEFMLGIDDLDAHNLRQELIAANKAYEEINGELKAIYRVMKDESQAFKRETIAKEIGNSEAAIAELENRQKSIRAERIESLNEGIKQRASEINNQLRGLASKQATLLDQKTTLNAELIDTKLFLDSLQLRRGALEQSMITNSELGDVAFKYCPACLAPIEEHGNNTCGLCKTEKSGSERHFAYMQMINELNFQIRESQTLVTKFQSDVDEINVALPKLERDMSLLKNEFQALTENADAVDATLSEVAAEIGFHRSQIVNLKEKIELVEKIEQLQTDKEKANIKISRIKDKLNQIEASNEERREKVFASIEHNAIDLLTKDGGYEPVFNEPEEVTFDFSRDKMYVNGRSKFSASSMVIMKNSIRASIFLEAVCDQKMRMPRLLLNDNIEDKGMTESRSQNFQRNLVEACLNLDNEFQLIFTTSMIDPDLNESDYVVGPYYNLGEHTLAIS